MITLDKTTRSIKISLAGTETTNPLSAVATVYDVLQRQKEDTGEYFKSIILEESNGTTAVTLVPAPDREGKFRRVPYISIHNTDTTTAVVKVTIEDSALSPTSYHLVTMSLDANQTLEFNETYGWKKVT